MSEEFVLRKIRKIPQTRYTLAENKTDLIKVHKIVKRLEKRGIICRRYFHINGTRQTVYIPKNLDGFLLNYLMIDIDDGANTKQTEYLLFFKDYKHMDLEFFIKKCYLLDKNKWIRLKNVYLDKGKVRCFC